jgi:BNR/Asp-box repeat
MSMEDETMATRMADQVMLLAGTRDGLYIFKSNLEREQWSICGPFLEGYDINHAVLDPRDGQTIWVAANGNGEAAIYKSGDRGRSWERSGEPFEADLVWQVTPALDDMPDSVYAGIMPAMLYRSDDQGQTWNEVEGLAKHPSREEWWPGGGGMCLHTIVTNPLKPRDLLVAMSVGGVLYSEDGGETWEPRNVGTFSMAEEWSKEAGRAAQHEVHRCTHKVARHPNNGLLFQQNHVGVYRSTSYGREWEDISEGLPNRFGFVIDVTQDGTVFVVPQHDWEPEIGVRVTGQLAAYRSRDSGDSWERLTNGLPEVENVTLYREGMATDLCDSGGVYFGTSDGVLHYSRDGGDSWHQLATGLPPVRAVTCEHYTV